LTPAGKGRLANAADPTHPVRRRTTAAACFGGLGRRNDLPNPIARPRSSAGGRAKTLISSGLRGTLFPAVATILVAGVDVFFRGKLDALLAAKHKLVTTDSVHQPDLVIVDIARVDPDEVAEEYPDIPILGFTNHTDTAGLRAAQAAGFDRVVVRSALAERAPEIIEELVT
jgi:hypothetical protein